MCFETKRGFHLISITTIKLFSPKAFVVIKIYLGGNSPVRIMVKSQPQATCWMGQPRRDLQGVKYKTSSVWPSPNCPSLFRPQTKRLPPSAKYKGFGDSMHRGNYNCQSEQKISLIIWSYKLSNFLPTHVNKQVCS